MRPIRIFLNEYTKTVYKYIYMLLLLNTLTSPMSLQIATLPCKIPWKLQNESHTKGSEIGRNYEYSTHILDVQKKIKN